MRERGREGGGEREKEKNEKSSNSELGRGRERLWCFKKKKEKKGKYEKSTLFFQEQKLLVKICLRRRFALIFQLISDTLFPPRFRTKCFKLASARRDSPSGDLSSSVNTLKGASAILNYH